MKKKTQKAKLDKLWSEIVRTRDNHRCRVCGRSPVNAHHIIGRNNLHLRYDIRNGYSLCVAHHTFGNESAHKNGIWFTRHLEAEIPDILEYLEREQNVKEFNFDYEECEKELNRLLNLYK